MQIETFAIETFQSGVCLVAILATRFVKRKQVFVNTPRKKTPNSTEELIKNRIVNLNLHNKLNVAMDM